MRFADKIKTIHFGPTNVTPKFYRTIKDVESLAQDPIQKEITRSRPMMNTIRHGNASDKSLTRDVTEMQRDFTKRTQTEWRERKLAGIKERKEKYKARYGCEA